MRRTSIFTSLLCLALIFGVFTTTRAQEEVVFPETGHRVSGRFLQFWRQQGGLAVFGYPLTDQLTENGRSVQYFERQRFELHPENQAPYDVLLGRLGAEILPDWQSQPTAAGAVAGCTYFAETRHNVCNQQAQAGFLNYWQSHGLEFDGRAGKSYAESLALFGLPITEPYQYTNSSGVTVQTQWFERSRFEWYPNNPNEFKVQLGRLGAELGSSGTAQPIPAGAVQTVVTYYDAINRRSFAEAYAQWANNGAASNQTQEQFTEGFDNTVRVSLLLGNPKVLSADLVEVPVTILGVINVPRGNPDQQVQQFQGSYRVQRFGNTWKLASAALGPFNGPLPPSQFASPINLLQSYYAAINDRQFARAYTYWNNLGQASNLSFGDFQQGFATTGQVAITLGTPEAEGAAGSIYITVPIVIVATQNDRSVRTYCGDYTLRGLNVQPFNQFGLRIESARIFEAGSGVRPDTDQVQQLLTGCQQQ
ncbi:MAG: hypothetical protein JOZ51_24085 [Chloroflexi bacterium]|nr:hypothetical protein [Chloroflexota bacterium]